MAETKKINRREFIKKAGLSTLGTLGLTINSDFKHLNAQTLENIPLHRIVEIRNNHASNWSYSTGYYFDYFDQQVIESMFNDGLCKLTQTNSPKEAWATVMSSYNSGDKIAIKLNLNNNGQMNNQIDATAPVLNCIMCGLVENLGIPVEDIWPFDATGNNWDLKNNDGRRQRIWDRMIYKHYYEPSQLWSDVYVDWSFSSSQSYLYSTFITNSQHLINLSLFKTHWMGVTASMKNHIGSRQWGHMTEVSNTPELADMYKTPHIRDKTRLIVGDCIFGTVGGSTGIVNRFNTCNNNSPNALFFGVDPVAFDSVLWDYLNDETSGNKEHGFLDIAANPPYNLGIHEHYHGDHDYNNIELIKIKPQAPVSRTDIDKMVKNHKDGLASTRNVQALIYRYKQGI